MALSAGLILLYLSRSVAPEALHLASHESASTLIHSAENEKDPCHQTLFHHAQKGGCHHQFHFTSEKKCPLCAVTSLADQLLNQISGSAIVNSDFAYCDFPISAIVSRSPGLLRSRAPPRT